MKRRDFVHSAILAAATLPTLRFVPALGYSGSIADIFAVTTDGRAVTLKGA